MNNDLKPKSEQEIIKEWFETNDLPLNKKNYEHFKNTLSFKFYQLECALQNLKKAIIKALYG